MSTYLAGAAPTSERVTPDPTKHVNYTLGMILGAEDFDQEFAWLAGRQRWSLRDTVGYGTVNGLRVTVTQGQAGSATADPVEPEVRVSCGTAVTPRGELVRVPAAQCAQLDRWLQNEDNRAAVTSFLGTAGHGKLPLYVVLCWDDLETDARPIPGEPCRDEKDTMAASRIADSFRLELRTYAPAHVEDRELRAFAKWLADAVVIGDTSEGTLEQFLDRVRAAAHSGPEGARGFAQAPAPTPKRIARADAARWLRAAQRVWATELRPPLHQEFGAYRECCAQTTSSEQPDPCLLLGQLKVPLTHAGVVDRSIANGIELNEDERPVVGHLRLLQEWLTCGPGAATDISGTVDPTTLQGKFVELAEAQRYAIVAAGVVNQTTSRRSFGELKAMVGGDGEVLLTFLGYKDPALQDEFIYVVKVLPVLGGGRDPVLVNVRDVTAKGVLLLVTNVKGEPIPEATLRSLPLMVEISRVGRPPVGRR